MPNFIPSKCIVPAHAIIKPNSLAVIIASAGIGRRMKSKGAKALLPIRQETTILEHQIKTIWKMYPQAEIIVTIGFQASKIRSLFRNVYPIRFIYNPNYQQTNVMCSVAMAMECSLSNTYLILHGDILFNNAAIAEITGQVSKVFVLPERYKENKQEVGVAINENQVTNLSYGLNRIWGQMVYLAGKEVKLFENAAFNYDSFSGRFLYEGINNVIMNNGYFRVHSPNNTNFVEINSMEDLAKAKREIV